MSKYLELPCGCTGSTRVGITNPCALHTKDDDVCKADSRGEHDWRVDPWQILLTMPPRQRLVCVRCRAVSGREVPGHQQPSRDPELWEKA